MQSEPKGVELGGTIRSECWRSVDEFTAMAERWGFWSDGCGELPAVLPRLRSASSRFTAALPRNGYPQW